jgi:hypothetical protein
VSNLLQQLKSLKNNPKAGASSLSEHGAAKARLLARVSADLPVRQESTSYVSWYVSSLISKPVTVGVAAVTLFTGSLSTVSAASSSLPGETLYSVKRITEQAQLRLASLDRRAVLHTEFAERRLREAVELRSSSADEGHQTLAKAAMVEYASELSQASADLKNLKDTVGSSTALAVVTDVQNKIDSMKAVIEETASTNSTTAAGTETVEAKNAVKETQTVATTVAVDVHEQEATAKSSLELKSMFTKELGSIEARQTFDEHRLDTIARAVAGAEMFKGIEGIPTGDDLKRMNFVIKQTRLQIPEAMNGFAAGGYRNAFTTLQGIDAELLKLEANVADIEILIMQTRADADAKAAEEAAKAEAEKPAEEAPPVTSP